MYPIIDIFGLKISSYFIMAILGCVAAFLLYIFYTKKYFPGDRFDRNMLFIYGLFGAFLGSKLLYIIVEWNKIFSCSNIITAIANGGFVFYGGLLGGMLFTAIYCKKQNLKWFTFADSICAPLCLGHAIGRIGCFLAGCCYGTQTDLPIGVVYPQGGIAPSGIRLLPTQLMESAFLLILCVFLLVILRKKITGLAAGCYLTLYGIWRFAIEFFRDDNRGSILFFSTSQFISIFIIAIGLAIIVSATKSVKSAFKK